MRRDISSYIDKAPIHSVITNKPQYVPSTIAFEFIAFIRAGGLEKNISPEFHYKIADKLFSSDEKERNLIIKCLRGAGKSTLVEYAVIFAAVKGIWPNFGKVPFIAFLGHSAEGNVQQFIKNVTNKIAYSPFYSSLLEITRDTLSEIELMNKDGVRMYILGKGMNQNFRGLRSSGEGNSGDRPSLIIADDISDNRVLNSEAVRKVIEDNWYGSVLPAIDPNSSRIIYIATPLMEGDLLHLLEKSSSYAVAEFPLCPEFPVAEEDYQSIWPDRFTYKYASEIYEQFESAGKTAVFYREYLLEATDLSTRLVLDDDIRWFDPSFVAASKDKYNIYIATDFATSTNKSADFSIIGVLAVNSLDDWMLVDGICKRQSLPETLNDLFRLVRKWSPLSVGIESAGQQGGFISIIEAMMLEQNVWFTLAKAKGSNAVGIRPMTNKLHRFVTGVQPKFKQKKVWIPKPDLIFNANPELYDLVTELVDNELAKFTHSGGVKALKHDDAIDMFNQFSEMETYPAADYAIYEESKPSYYFADGQSSEYGGAGSTIF